MDVVSVLLIAVLAILFLAATLDSYDLLNPFRAKVVSDPLAFLGVGSATLAFLLWAVPARVCWWGGSQNYPQPFCGQEFFSLDRLPFAAAFLALSFILLLLRRR
jgi:hypothetical protein